MTTTPLRRALAGALAAGLLLAACSDDGTPSSGAKEVGPVLTSLADGVIIPSYEALVTNLSALDSALGSLCTTPSADGLELARSRWRDSELAWESTRPTGVGPVVQQRAMSSIAFKAKPEKVLELIAGTDPLDSTSLNRLGSDVRGLGGIEAALFSPGSDALATAAGARGCTYASSAADLAITAAQAVLDAWTAPTDGYRATFLAGMDGAPQSSVDAIVNEVTFRLQGADDQGTRSLAEATSPDDLPASRREGPAAFGIASLRGILGGVAAAIHGPDGQPGLAQLVRERSAGTADRLEAATDAVLDALRALPDSSAAALADHAAVQKAADAMSALRVLVSTEVASQLGVTIGFSDADGDS